MAETINLFGSQVKKGYVIAGGVVVGAAVIYGWRKNKSSQTANTSAASTPSAPSSASYGGSGSSDPYPPDGSSGNPSDPDSTDPATGMTYGDENAEGQFSTGYGTLGGYGGYGYGGGYYPPGVTGTPTYTTNGEWAQAAEQYLTSTVGANPETVAAALGKYITGQAVTAGQQQVIEQAIAFGGYPPQNGPNGFPPNIQTSHTPPPHPAQVTVPDVLHMEQAQAFAVLSSLGLKPSGQKPVKGKVRIVTAESPKAGSKVNPGSTVKLTTKLT